MKVKYEKDDPMFDLKPCNESWKLGRGEVGGCWWCARTPLFSAISAQVGSKIAAKSMVFHYFSFTLLSTRNSHSVFLQKNFEGFLFWFLSFVWMLIL